MSVEFIPTKVLASDECMKCGRGFSPLLICCCSASSFKHEGKEWHVAGMCVDCCDHRAERHQTEYRAYALGKLREQKAKELK